MARRCRGDVVSCEVTLTAEAHARLVRDAAAAMLRVLSVHATDHRIAYALREVARITGLSMRHLKREIKRGELPTVWPGSGNRQMVLAEHLQLWLYGQHKPSDEPQMNQQERMRRVRSHRKKKEGPSRDATQTQPQE
jgi:hypothetical protein